MPPCISYTDHTCWTGLQNDDPVALGHLYDAYIDKLFLTAMFITNDRELAKDALQEVFIEIWNYRKTISDVQNTQAYLTKILKRIIFKKQRFTRSLTISVSASELLSDDQGVEQAIISTDTENEKQLRLRNAVAELSKRQKLILDLRFNQGLTYDQIAEKLGMNYQSVNNLAHRTFRRLRSAMTPFMLLFLSFL